MKHIISLTVISMTALLYGCGGDSKKNTESEEGNGSAANISYLKTNHSNYTQYAGEGSPTPIKKMDALSLQWSIVAKTETDAIKLYDHINFMVSELKAGENPRAWDKLFLLEAYMKTSHRYTTVINKEEANKLLIIKTATDRCAYDVISAHSDAVSGDFFGQGIINKDYSSIAENIINSAACSISKVNLVSYIRKNQKPKDH